MELSKERKSLLIERFKRAESRKKDALACPVCGFKESSIKTSEFQLLSLNQTDGTPNNPNINILPVAAIVCKNCGHVELFSLEN